MVLRNVMRDNMLVCPGSGNAEGIDQNIEHNIGGCKVKGVPENPLSKPGRFFP
jgi:hypothetical protein